MFANRRRTFKTSLNCVAIAHSRFDNSYALRPSSRSAQIASMASRYSIENSSMSCVEFQRVRTSRGMRRSDNFNRLRMSCQAGNNLVVECIILKANLRSWTQVRHMGINILARALTLTSTFLTGRTCSSNSASSSAVNEPISSTHDSSSSSSFPAS